MVLPLVLDNTISLRICITTRPSTRTEIRWYSLHGVNATNLSGQDQTTRCLQFENLKQQ